MENLEKKETVTTAATTSAASTATASATIASAEASVNEANKSPLEVYNFNCKKLTALEQLSIYPELFSADDSLRSVPNALEHYIDRLEAIKASPEALEAVRTKLITECKKQNEDSLTIIQSLGCSLEKSAKALIKSENKKAENLLQLLQQFSSNETFLIFVGSLITMQKSYLHQYTDKNLLVNLRNIFNGLYDKLSEIEPEIFFKFLGRRKSLISFEEKAISNIASGQTPQSLKDIYGFRIVITDGTEDDCYKCMQEAITFLVLNDCMLDDPTPLKGTKTSKKNLSKIAGIKDYILNPKGNGYKSLHAQFVTSDGYRFEVQVRTDKMDFVAEKGDAAHDGIYKTNNHQGIIPFLNMRGFIKDSQGNYSDNGGIIDPVQILVRNKTF